MNPIIFDWIKLITALIKLGKVLYETSTSLTNCSKKNQANLKRHKKKKRPLPLSKGK